MTYTFYVLQNSLGAFIFIDNDGFGYPCDLLCQATIFETVGQAAKYANGLIIRTIEVKLL